jgi:hypothetical protein
MSERRCGTCRWWGDGSPYTDEHRAINLYRPCNWPVPMWLRSNWASPPEADGTTCPTWQPADVERGDG